MKKMTEIDPLTGLFNRFAYEYRISEMKKKEKLPENLIIFAMDLNGLKNVNDSKGHDAGDAMIYDAAQCILRGIGSKGECYRVGGDEFTAIFTDAGVDPWAIKQKIKDEAEACCNENYSVSISVGYCIGEENADMRLEDFEKHADKMMYQDKENYYITRGINRRTRDEDFREICDSYLKKLKVNLDSGDFDIIKMDIREKEKTSGFSRDIRIWMKDFAQCQMLYEDDRELFLEKTDPDFLRKQFEEDKAQTVRIPYRRLVGDTYHKVMMEIVPGKGYSEKQQMVYLYVKDLGVKA